jgi:hypothetical protein
MSNALEALRRVDFNWVRSLESIWSDTDPVTHGSNETLAREILVQFHRETQTAAARPNGRAVIGQSGIGKTHLVCNLRHQVWDSGAGLSCSMCWA